MDLGPLLQVTHGPGLERGVHRVASVVDRPHDRRNSQRRFLEPANELDAALARQVQVHDQQVGHRRPDHGPGLLGGCEGSGQPMTGYGLQHARERLPQGGTVLNQGDVHAEDTDGRTSFPGPALWARAASWPGHGTTK